jgi:Spy/CpxP family protein refolding chaperone
VVVTQGWIKSYSGLKAFSPEPQNERWQIFSSPFLNAAGLPDSLLPQNTMIMKRLILLAIMSLAMAAGVQAQGKWGRRADDRQMAPGRGLNLNEQQRIRMKQVVADHRNRAEAVRNNPNLSEAQKREQLKNIQQSRQQQVAAILTPEQQRQMRDWRQNRRVEGRGDGQFDPRDRRWQQGDRRDDDDDDRDEDWRKGNRNRQGGWNNQADRNDGDCHKKGNNGRGRKLGHQKQKRKWQNQQQQPTQFPGWGM